MTKTYQLETLTCPSCIRRIEGALGKLKGVKKAEVLFNASKLKVDFDESLITGDEIKKAVQTLGYDVLGEK